jgi:UDP-N-acetyl-D-mannosaminuronic acid transferase (WecB/TagA/CpsF family)
MYEVDFTGWTRTPEELIKIKLNCLYRLKLNWKRFKKRPQWHYFIELIFNKNNF